ncbi:hypothetical protein MMC11_006111 [Xylographa trunciseda]|nr:hypothetical protein [Xylographa trunciseda]
MDRKRKRELRDLNLRTWAGDKDVFSTNGSLDSSLKKNTAFIKRLRTAITATAVSTFLQEISLLSLHKYLSEVISASYEGLCRLKTPSEIAAGIEVVSALHQRFGSTEYTCYLGWLLGRGLSTPDRSQLKNLTQDVKEKEERERLARQRILLKVVTELWLVGVLRSLEDVARPEDATVKGKENTGPNASKLGELVNKSKSGSQSSKTTSPDAEAFPLEALKDLLVHDKEHVNLSLVVLFVKSFGWDVLGVKSGTEGGRQTVEADGVVNATADYEDTGSADEAAPPNGTVTDTPLIGPELQERFKNVLDRYLEDVKLHLVKEQKAIAAQARRNAEVYVKSGEVFEDRQASYDKQLKAQEKFTSNVQILCDALGSDMPDLKEKDITDSAGITGIGLIKTGEYLRGQGEGAGIWEDEEERRFYENLIDLKDRVPGVLLEEPKKKKVDSDEQVGKRVDNAQPGGQAKVTQETSPATDTAEEQSTAIANKTVGAQVDSLLARLPELQSKEAVDQAAMDFCFLNSKASRNRLIKAVQEVPKGRTDLLPLYSRLIATLGKYLPDVSHGLVSHLDEEFRSLQRRKQKDFLGQVRTGNIRYLAELTKFGVVPEHVIFHCLKVSIDDFSRMNIEIIGNLLENCGRYLLRNLDTAPRMKSFLETLQRKKAAQHLGQQERMIIENAMYYVNPPERAAIQQKERTPVDLFVRKIVYLDMNKRTYTKVLKSIRKLHWEEPEVVELLERIFSKPGKVKYSNIHLLAMVVAALYRYHQDFVVTIIDTLLEQITLGLEQNDFKFNQRRIAEVKYLGELYNYKMVDSPVIFDTMYRIVTFGHRKSLEVKQFLPLLKQQLANGTPTQDRFNSLDMPDDFFRIRLICNVLDTCGICFDRGAAKKKLDFFLTFFQYYIHTKDPLPMDIDFIIQDTYALTRPQWKLVASLEEAGSAFSDAVSQNYKSQEPERIVEPEDVEDDASSDGGDEDERRVPEMDDAHSSSEEVEQEVTLSHQGLSMTYLQYLQTLTNGDAKHSSDFEEDIIVTRQETERDLEAEAEFDRELAKMMSESIDSRKSDRKQMFDVPLPMRRAQRDTSTAADDSPSEGTATPPNTMAFSLMTKKGNRQQTRTIDLPSDSHFAIAMKSQKEAERAEQQRIKNLVLNYDLQDSADHDGIDNSLYSQYFSTPNPNLPKHYHTLPSTITHSHLSQGLGGGEKYGASHHQHNASLHQSAPNHSNARPADKSGANRSGQRARKLQLSDVDWYEPKLEQHTGFSLNSRGRGRGRGAYRRMVG